MAQIFCYNCGTKLDSESRFCAECGVSICEEQGSRAGGAATAKSVETACGMIFTNTKHLAQKFGVERATIITLLQRYIAQLKGGVVEYSLLDASDYTFKNPSRNGVHFDATSYRYDFESYIAVVSDAYHYGYAEKKPTFLFIIGDMQTIPMCKIANYLYTPVNGFSDSDVDSDLPYSFLTQGCSVELMSSFGIILRPYLLHVGRLPFGVDSSFEALERYLQRNIDMATSKRGIAISQSYAQIDPHWAYEASEVATVLNKNGLLSPKVSDSDYTYNKIYTTPSVVLGNVDSYFNVSADLLYFNMHGSAAPHAPFFFGEGLDEKNEGGAGISPAQLTYLKGDNVVVTEACYGARFDGLKVSQSMLISALSAKTLVYMGSSRIALAASIDSPEDSAYISCADVIAKLFMEELMRGNLAGVAFTNARRGYLERLNGQIGSNDKLTLAEFNLFGDPTVMIYSEAKGRGAVKPAEDVGSLADDSVRVGAQTAEESIYVSQDTGSLLSFIRQSVDRNIAEVRDAINSYMYGKYGLDKSSLKSISRERSADGRQSSLKFLYSTKSSQFERVYITSTSEDGKIKSVIISK